MLSSTTPIHINLQKIKRNRRTKKYKKKQTQNKMCLLPASQFKLHLYLSQPVKTRVSSEYRSLPNVLIQTSMYKKNSYRILYLNFFQKVTSAGPEEKKKKKKR